MVKDKSVAEVVVACLARHGVEVIFSQSLPSAALLAAEDAGIRTFTYLYRERRRRHGRRLRAHFRQGRRGHGTERTGRYTAGGAARGSAEILGAHRRAGAGSRAADGGPQRVPGTRPHRALRRLCQVDSSRDRAIARRRLRRHGIYCGHGGRPGPAVLLLPADLLKERTTAFGRRRTNLGSYPLDRALPEPARLDAAADLIAKARLPIVMAGGGVHLSDAAHALAALQQDAHLPVMTTVMGKGAVAETHPLSLGVGGNVLGRLSPSRHLRALTERADVVILVGTRTAQNGTDSWTMFPQQAQVIHIDADPGEIGRNYEATLRLAGDAKLTLLALAERLRGRRRRDEALEREIAAAKEKNAAVIAPLLCSNAAPVRPERLAADLQRVLTPDTIVVADASYSSVWIACYMTALAPGMRFLTPRGIAGLGWGPPLALGAKVARPGAPVLCMTGDGAFGHVWSELETARRTATPLVITVLNNGVLAYQKDAEDVKFGRHTSACVFSPVDHAQIARACGCRGVTVKKADDYLPAVREALAVNATTVIDVDTDPEAYPPITLFDDKLDDLRAQRSRSAMDKAA